MRVIKRTFCNFSQSTLLLGKAGENLATKLEIDISKELREFPEPVFELVLKMPASTDPYPVLAEVAGEKLTYSFTGSDLAESGYGEVEALVCSSEGQVLKSTTAKTKIDPSIIPNAYPPPLQKVIDDINKSIEDVASANHVKNIEANLTWEYNADPTLTVVTPNAYEEIVNALDKGNTVVIQAHIYPPDGSEEVGTLLFVKMLDFDLDDYSSVSFSSYPYDGEFYRIEIDSSNRALLFIEKLDKKVDKVAGKGLSEKDFTAADQAKLNGIDNGAEVNVIDSITLNGEPVTVTNKTAAISAVVDNSYVHTDNNFNDAEKTKLAAVDVKYSVQHYADLLSLPQTAGTRATVQNDGNQLTFGTFDLEINNDLAAPAVFPIPNMSNIGGIYDYQSGGSGRSVTVGFTRDATDGTPLILVYVSVNGVTYMGISRDAKIVNTNLTKGWYISSDFTPAQKPTLDDFNIVRFSIGGTTYTSGDTLPTDRIRLLSRFINISQNDMQQAGDYVYSGSAWEYVPKEDELIYFTGELLPNRKYFCHIGQDLSLTLPAASAIDTSRDNSILLYLECTADVDLSFPSGTRFYGGIMPDTTAGSHELTFICNPNTGLWTVGGLDSEAIS